MCSLTASSSVFQRLLASASVFQRLPASSSVRQYPPNIPHADASAHLDPVKRPPSVGSDRPKGAGPQVPLPYSLVGCRAPVSHFMSRLESRLCTRRHHAPHAIRRTPYAAHRPGAQRARPHCARPTLWGPRRCFSRRCLNPSCSSRHVRVSASAAHTVQADRLSRRCVKLFKPTLFKPKLFKLTLFKPKLFKPTLFKPKLFTPTV